MAQVTRGRDEIREELLEILRDPIPDDPIDSYIDFGASFAIASAYAGKPRPAANLGGWDNMNKIIRGFPPNQFSILSGRSGVGKTTLLCSWTLDLVSRNVPHYVASIELGHGEYMANLISGMIGKSYWDLTESEKEKQLHRAGLVLNTRQSVFSTYDSRVPHLDMLVDILHAHRTKNIQVVFVDNINFIMEPTKGADQNLHMDRVIHDFVIFCKKVPVHIVMVMHPRKTEGDGRIKGMFDIKGSSTAVQESANVMLLNLLDKDVQVPFGENPKLCREILFDKVRFNGRETGSKIITVLESNGHIMREAKYVN